jgi:hypothetical protein
MEYTHKISKLVKKNTFDLIFSCDTDYSHLFGNIFMIYLYIYDIVGERFLPKYICNTYFLVMERLAIIEVFHWNDLAL